MNIKINARKVMETPAELLWERLKDPYYDVVFDDTTITVKSTELKIAHLTWGCIRKYPATPLTSDLVLEKFITDGYVSNKGINNLLTKVLILTYHHNNVQDINELLLIIFKDNNRLYNLTTLYTEEYSRGMNHMDFVDFYNAPALKDIRDRLEAAETLEEQEMIHSEIEDAILNTTHSPEGERYVVNYFALGHKGKVNQYGQSLVARGTTQDLSHKQYPVMVTSNLLNGNNYIHEVALVGRDAAVAASSSTGDLQTVSDESRRLSSAAMSRTKIWKGDCGTISYMSLKITHPEVAEDGTVIKDSNLVVYVGATYMCDEIGVLKTLKHSDTHLYGKIIKQRSLFTCEHGVPGEVCSTCYGALAISIPYYMDTGVNTTKELLAIMIQMTISMKHVVGKMSGTGTVTLSDKAKALLKFKDGLYYLKRQQRAISHKLIISKSEFTGINDIYIFDRVKDMTISQISSVKSIKIIVERKMSTTLEEITVTAGKEGTMLDYGILEYIKANPHHVTSDAHSYVIELADYDTDKPILVRPIVVPSFRDIADSISALYQRSSKEYPVSSTSMIYTLSVIIDIMIVRSKVNFAVYETILAAYLCKPGTFLPAATINDAYHARGVDVISQGSISRLLIARDQGVPGVTPAHYLLSGKDRGDASLDPMVDPEGYLKHHPIPKGETVRYIVPEDPNEPPIIDKHLTVVR